MIKPTDLQNGMVRPDELMNRREPEPLPHEPIAGPPCDDEPEPVVTDDGKEKSP